MKKRSKRGVEVLYSSGIGLVAKSREAFEAELQRQMDLALPGRTEFPETPNAQRAAAGFPVHYQQPYTGGNVPTPINPNDIRPGDLVRPIDTGKVYTVKAVRSGVIEIATSDGWPHEFSTSGTHVWDRTWELIERPTPKPAIGSVWIRNVTGGTYVFAQDDVWLCIKSATSLAVGNMFPLAEFPVTAFTPTAKSS